MGELVAIPVPAKELKGAGLSAAALRAVGFELSTLKEAGFGIGSLRAAGASAEDLRRSELFSLPELKKVGFDVHELRKAGFDVQELRGVGFKLKALRSAFSAADFKRCARETCVRPPAEPSSLAPPAERSSFAIELHPRAEGAPVGASPPRLPRTLTLTPRCGLEAKELRVAGGFSAADLWNVGYTPEVLTISTCHQP